MHCLSKLTVVVIPVAQPETGACHEHRISGAVEMGALRRPQQLAGGKAQLGTGIERAGQLLDVVRRQLDIVVQQQNVTRVGRRNGAVD